MTSLLFHSDISTSFPTVTTTSTICCSSVGRHCAVGALTNSDDPVAAEEDEQLDRDLDWVVHDLRLHADAHQLHVTLAGFYVRAEQRSEVHRALLLLHEQAPRRCRPLDERDGNALDGRQREGSLEAGSVEVLLDVLPELLVLTLAKDGYREAVRAVQSDFVVERGTIIRQSNGWTRETGVAAVRCSRWNECAAMRSARPSETAC